MPSLKLGTSGSEVTLPVLGRIGGVPTINVNESPQLQEATMSDGSRRVARFTTKRSWDGLRWDALTLSQLAVFQGLSAIDAPLRFQLGHEGTTWYTVYISAFAWEPDLSTSGPVGAWYSVTLSLREL
jgi:hypothetical protein